MGEHLWMMWGPLLEAPCRSLRLCHLPGFERIKFTWGHCALLSPVLLSSSLRSCLLLCILNRRWGQMIKSSLLCSLREAVADYCYPWPSVSSRDSSVYHPQHPGSLVHAAASSSSSLALMNALTPLAFYFSPGWCRFPHFWLFLSSLSPQYFLGIYFKEIFMHWVRFGWERHELSLNSRSWVLWHLPWSGVIFLNFEVVLQALFST